MSEPLNVGAGGVWQFMAGAARAYGLEVSHWVDARRDPERAAEAAAHYLKDLYVRFGSWHLAFAAYNAGYGAVLQSIARYNTNDFWELCRHEAGLPWETTLYVPKIVAAAIVGAEAVVAADFAADCARELTEAMWGAKAGAGASKPATLGEAMTALRRSTLAAGNPLAFLFHAIGNVDLTVQEESP